MTTNNDVTLEPSTDAPITTTTTPAPTTTLAPTTTPAPDPVDPSLFICPFTPPVGSTDFAGGSPPLHVPMFAMNRSDGLLYWHGYYVNGDNAVYTDAEESKGIQFTSRKIPVEGEELPLAFFPEMKEILLHAIGGTADGFTPPVVSGGPAPFETRHFLFAVGTEGREFILGRTSDDYSGDFYWRPYMEVAAKTSQTFETNAIALGDGIQDRDYVLADESLGVFAISLDDNEDYYTSEGVTLGSRFLFSKPGLKTLVCGENKIYASDGASVFLYTHNYSEDAFGNPATDEWIETTLFTLPTSQSPTFHGQGVIKKIVAFAPYGSLSILIEQEPGNYSPDGGVSFEDKLPGHQQVAILDLSDNTLVRYDPDPLRNNFFCGVTFIPVFDLENQTRADLYYGDFYSYSEGNQSLIVASLVLNGRVEMFSSRIDFEGVSCERSSLSEYDNYRYPDVTQFWMLNGEPNLQYELRSADAAFCQVCPSYRLVGDLPLPDWSADTKALLVSLANVPEDALDNIDDTRELGRVVYVAEDSSGIYDAIPGANRDALFDWEGLVPLDTSLGQPDVDDSSKPIDVALDRHGRVAALGYENGSLYYASVPGFSPTNHRIDVTGAGPITPGSDVIRSICMVPDAEVFPSLFASPSHPAPEPPALLGPTCNYPSPFDASGEANVAGSESFFVYQRLQFDVSGNNSITVDKTYWKDNPSGTEKYVILGTLEAKYEYPTTTNPVATPQHSLSLKVTDETFGNNITRSDLVKQIFDEYDDGTIPATNRLTPSSYKVQQHVMEAVDMPFGADVSLEFALAGSESRHSAFKTSLGMAAFYVGDLTENLDYELTEEQTYLVDAIGGAYQTEIHQILPGLTNSEDWVSFVRLQVTIPAFSPAINAGSPDSFNVDVEFKVQLWDTDNDVAVAEHPLLLKGYFSHSPTLSFVHILSTNDVAGNLDDGHMPNYEVRILSTRNTALGTPTLKTLIFSIRAAAINSEVYRDEIEENSFDFNVVDVIPPAVGVCPIAAIVGSKAAKVNGVSISYQPDQMGWAPFTQSPFFNANLPGNGSAIRGVAPLLDLYGRGVIPQDPTNLVVQGVYLDSDVGGNFGLVYQPGASAPTTTPAPTTTAGPTTTAEPAWTHGWVYAACKDGIRSFTDTQQAFLAHAGGATGVCAADGPAIYFTAPGGEVYYANPELTSKVLVYKDETLTEMGDIAYDATQDRLIVHANRGGLAVIFKLQRNGTFAGVLADVGAGLNQVVGRMEVHPSATLLYLAGAFSQTPEFSGDAGPVQAFPSYRYPALMDSSRLVGDPSFDLVRQRQTILGGCQLLPRSFGFSGAELLGADTTPVLTTTTTTAATTTTTPAPTTTPEPTTGTGTGTTTTTTPAPTLPTTTPAPTTLGPTTPPPGDVPCWNSTPGVQAFPANGMIRITQSTTNIEQIDQLVTGLAPGLELVLTVELSQVVDKTRIFIANEAQTILGVQVVTSPGVWKTTATVPESGTVRVGVRLEAGETASYIQVEKVSLKSCDVGFAPQEAVTGKWQGYLVTGELTSANLEQGLQACFTGENLPALQVEPGRIFSAAGLSRKTIEVWSQDRTKWTGDPDCNSNIPATDRGYVQQYEGQPDDFRISGGHQASVRQESSQTLVFGAFPGGGELGPPPGEIPLYPGEVPLDDRTYLDNGLACNEVVRSINGVGGPHLEFRSDRGVLIEPHPELHRTVIHVNGEGINFCPDFASPEQVECLAPRTEFCGPKVAEDEPCPGAPDLRGGYVAGGQVLSLPVARSSQALVGSSDFGTCDYRRELNGWKLINSSPAFNCECRAPKVYGHLDQEVRIAAVPMAADPFFVIRNPYFAEDLSHWQGVELTWIESDANHLDGVSHVLAEESLEQPMIPVEAGKYRLQCRFEVVGLVMYALKRQSNGEVFLSGVLGQNDLELVTDFVTIPATELLLSFAVSGSLRITEVGLVKWA